MIHAIYATAIRAAPSSPDLEETLMSATLPSPADLGALIIKTSPGKNSRALQAVLEAYYPTFHWSVIQQRQCLEVEYIVDIDGSLIATDCRAWIEEQFTAHSGNATAVWRSFQRNGYQRKTIEQFYLWIYGRFGTGLLDWLQLHVTRDATVSFGPLFNAEPAENLFDLHVVSDEGTVVAKTSPRYALPIDGPFYLGGPELPGYHGWPQLERWLGDWQASSAGQHHPFTFFGIRLDPTSGLRPMPFHPMLQRIPELPVSPIVLTDALQAFDKVSGWSFSWYFFVVLRQLPSLLPVAALSAVRNGALRLPTRDIKVLESWQATPYFF